ncbi:MAG TPA: hypothetical protein VNX00_02370 [Herbaspirillum sp.]|nr:hypothetical protein [Herbaspirillum sp.]
MITSNINAATVAPDHWQSSQSTDNQNEDARIRLANLDDPLLGSRMGGLSLVGDAPIAALKARVEFADKLIDFIVDKQWPAKRPLTLVSYGAGALLTEHMVHEGLLKKGFSQLRWRLIDTAYVNGGLYENRAHFSHGKADVHFFTTEAAYLGKKVGQCQMADADKTDGGAIVLVVEPQANIQAFPDLHDANPDYMRIQCIPIPDIKKSNCIYLLAEAPGKQHLAHVPAMLKAGKVAVALPDALRCFIDYGRPCVYIRDSASANGKYMHEKIKAALLKEQSCPLTLMHLDKILRGVIKRIEKSRSNPLSLMKFSGFDCTIGLFHLEQHFLDSGNPILFAALEDNHTVLATP